MARIFSINFTHDGYEHTAMVTVRTTPFFTEYSLMMEEVLSEQLPGTKIISTPSNALVFANATFDETTPLMTELIHAVRLHIQMPTT